MQNGVAPRSFITAIAVMHLAPLVMPADLRAQSVPDGSRPAMCLETVGPEGDTLLWNRIGPPDPAVLEMFAGAGASEIAEYHLSDEERVLVERALSRLHGLQRDVLRHHLRRLSFLDLQDGAGSALTSRVGMGGTGPQFDITLRASLLDEDLTHFLDVKEARLFADDGSGFRVEFDAGHTDALTYVLLHEATHVVDQVMGLSADEISPFRVDVWEDLRDPSEPHASSPVMRTPFRRLAPIPLRDTPALYESLRRSPFVSFYATAAAPEDLAELVAWQQLSSRFGQTLTLTIRDGEGRPVFRYEPLASPRVQERFGDVESWLDRYERECLSSPH